MSLLKWLWLALLTSVLAGCAHEPASLSKQDPPGTRQVDGLQLLERTYLEKTKRFAFEGKLVEASQAWEVLVALRPDLPDYRSALARVSALIEAATIDNFDKAVQAQRKGDLELAARHFLAVAGLKPDHKQAIEALRTIERDRVRHTQLGRSSSSMAVRKSQSDAQSTSRKNIEIRNVMEHAALLQRQGDMTEAIALIRVYLDSNPGDKDADDLLTELQNRKTDTSKSVRPTGRNASESR
jgi:tetratricopeptide (TPR) repeat protein